MDRKDADRAAVGGAAGAHGGREGRDLGIVEQRLARDVLGMEVVAARQRARRAEPGSFGDRMSRDREAIAAAAGDDPAVHVDEPEIEIDGVGLQDDGEAAGGMVAAPGRGFGGGVDDGAVGRPPADIAAALIEVAVDELDGIQGEIDHAGAVRRLGHGAGEGGKPLDLAAEFDVEPLGQGVDLLGNATDFLADDGKAAADLAGACRLDQGIEGKDLHAARYGANVGDLLNGEIARGDGAVDDRFDRRRIRRHGCFGSPDGGHEGALPSNKLTDTSKKSLRNSLSDY